MLVRFRSFIEFYLLPFPGKEVVVRIHSDGDKASYTLEVNEPDNDGED